MLVITVVQSSRLLLLREQLEDLQAEHPLLRHCGRTLLEVRFLALQEVTV